MKKKLLTGTLALAILLGTFASASAAGMKDKLISVKNKVVGGESKAVEIHGKFEDYIARADEEGYDTATAEAKMESAEASYMALIDELNEMEAMLDVAIAADEAPGDGSLRDQAEVIKAKLDSFKVDMLAVKDALMDIRDEAIGA